MIRKVCLALLVAFAVLHTHAQNKSYLIVFLNKNPNADALPKSEIDSILKGHMQNMERLAKEGKLLAAGPFTGGGGIFVMNSTSVTDVEDWINTDPGIKARRWNVEILPYTPRVGGICPVKPPYEMTQYSFVRFRSVSGRTGDKVKGILNDQATHLKQLVADSVVTEVSFGEKRGGILVIKGEIDPKIIEESPAVKNRLLSFEVKKLYIARGSFCEQ